MTDGKIDILIVDDEQIVLDSIHLHLRREECILHTVLTVDEALRILQEAPIDVVLTDLMMPDIDGLEFMKLVKDQKPKIPVIMITGYATVNTAMQATQLGAFDYVAKPFSKKELLGVVRRAMDLARAAVNGTDSEPAAIPDPTGSDLPAKTFKTIGDQSWMMLDDDGTVRLGIERSFMLGVGKVQTLYLPEVGDEVRQGSVYLRIFSTDMSSHSVLSALTGVVVAVNQKMIDDPNASLEDPYGEGWLIRIRPTRFAAEAKLLGL
ncbi:MAG: response regulator [bacterium]